MQQGKHITVGSTDLAAILITNWSRAWKSWATGHEPRLKTSVVACNTRSFQSFPGTPAYKTALIILITHNAEIVVSWKKPSINLIDHAGFLHKIWLNGFCDSRSRSFNKYTMSKKQWLESLIYLDPIWLTWLLTCFRACEGCEGGVGRNYLLLVWSHL